MVPVPAINSRLHLVTGDGGDNCPGGLSVVCLSWCVFVEWGEVHHAAGTTVWFGTDDHAVTPDDRVINWHFLQNSKLTVTIKAPLDIFLPMERYLAWSVNCYWGGLILNKDAQWWGAIHQGEWLLFTAVKGTALIPVQDIFFQDW